MNVTRTTVTLPSTVVSHIKEHPENGSISDFLTRAAINQLENECGDFAVREELEEEGYGKEPL